MRYYEPQPAYLIYPLDGGWQVMRYVWVHLFARTHAAAQHWFGWGNRRFDDAGTAGNLLFKYWWLCIGAGAYVAGAFEYLAAMIIVGSFAALHFLILTLWASLALLIIGVLSSFNFLYSHGYKIFFRCPACHAHMPVPIHICPTCRTSHTRLWPSVYGVFNHRCKTCNTLLATLDIYGRKAYIRECVKCHRTMNSRIGELINVHIPVVGGPWAGKSNLIFMAIRELLETYTQPRNYVARFIDDKDEFEYLQNIKQFDSGEALGKTTSMIPQAYTLELKKSKDRIGRILYLYDAAGEVYNSTDTVSQQIYYEHISGLILVVDPFAIPLFQKAHEAEITAIKNAIRPCPTDVEDTYSRMLDMVESRLGFKAQQIITIPVAVVISKTDALDLQAYIGHAAAQQLMAEDKSIILEEDAIHILVERFLAEYGMNNWLRDIRGRFESVRFFSCSALGRLLTPDDQRPFKPTPLPTSCRLA